MGPLFGIFEVPSQRGFEINFKSGIKNAAPTFHVALVPSGLPCGGL